MTSNVHEVWAVIRIAQDWQWGEACNDARKLHACFPMTSAPNLNGNTTAGQLSKH